MSHSICRGAGGGARTARNSDPVSPAREWLARTASPTRMSWFRLVVGRTLPIAPCEACTYGSKHAATCAASGRRCRSMSIHAACKLMHSSLSCWSVTFCCKLKSTLPKE